MTENSKSIHQSCPECRGSRAIVTERVRTKDTIYCPDCGNIWSTDYPTANADESSAADTPFNERD